MARTRIAPSPTGFPHIGTIYQSLFDFAFVKKNGGEFIVRIEDTDRERFIEGAEDVVYQSLDWFGLISDEDTRKGGPYAPYRQSERLSIYKKHAFELIDKGYAYYCFCTKEDLEAVRKDQELRKVSPMYNKHCLLLSPREVENNLKQKKPFVIRMKIPENRTITVNDMIIGDITFDSNTIDHQVLLKSDGFPTYHLAVVVDDHLMKITHIFRGKEWIPSTPKHVLLYEYFGWDMPIHAHLPLILNDQGKGKLSKRLGHASVDYYRDLGFFPEAILNYLTNIVWNHPQGKEMYSFEEFIKLFEIQQITSQGARFNLAKLEWMNGEYIRKMTSHDLQTRIFDFYKGKYSKELLEKTTPLIQERIKTLKEYDDYCRFFIEKPKTYEVDLHAYSEALKQTVDRLILLNSWQADIIGEVMQSVAKEMNMKNSDYFMVMRIAITGRKVTPPLNESIEILGKEEVVGRLTAIS